MGLTRLAGEKFCSLGESMDSRGPVRRRSAGTPASSGSLTLRARLGGLVGLVRLPPGDDGGSRPSRVPFRSRSRNAEDRGS